MAQIKRFSWTNPSTAVARNLDVGFTVAEVTTIDVTNGGSWYWIKGMGDGYVLDVDSGTVTTSNGFTPLSQNAIYGSAISDITAANPAVLTVADTAAAGFAVGDTIKVTEVADDGAGTTLNANYTIASLTATTITTATNTSSGYSAYVSGGNATRVTDTNGDAIPTENVAIRGVTVGTTPVGANDAVMVAIVKGEEPVV